MNEAQAVEGIAQGLFSLFKSILKVPTVRVQTGDISEKIFNKLAGLYQTHSAESSPSKKQQS